MQVRCLAFLLDGGLRTWGTREDLHLNLARAFVTRGVRPVFVFSEASNEALNERFRAVGAEVTQINYGKGTLHYYRELGRVVRKHSITAVHIAFFNYFDLIPWLARLKGVRQIVYQERNGGILRARGWKRRLIRLRTRAVTTPMTRVVAISDFIRRQLVEIGIPGEKICVVHHGVSVHRFSPSRTARIDWARRFAIERDEVIVSNIAHMRPIKHPEVILEAFARVTNRGVKARLFMAGDGEMRQEMEHLHHGLNISGRVHWLGNYDKPEKLLQATDIFVLASVGEAFGLVLLEAMACGVPVVGSRVGAIPEIVEDGKTGILATPLDPASFADALERLARNEELRLEMGKRAVERVRQRFTIETSINNLLKVYESMWKGPEKDLSRGNSYADR